MPSWVACVENAVIPMQKDLKMTGKNWEQGIIVRNFQMAENSLK